MLSQSSLSFQVPLSERYRVTGIQVFFFDNGKMCIRDSTLDGRINGRIIYQIVGVDCRCIKFLHGQGNVGFSGIVRQIREDIAAAGNLDHLGNIIGCLPYNHGAVGAHIEECHRLLGVLEILQVTDDLCLLLKELLCFAYLVGKDTINLEMCIRDRGMIRNNR